MIGRVETLNSGKFGIKALVQLTPFLLTVCLVAGCVPQGSVRPFYPPLRDENYCGDAFRYVSELDEIIRSIQTNWRADPAISGKCRFLISLDEQGTASLKGSRGCPDKADIKQVLEASSPMPRSRDQCVKGKIRSTPIKPYSVSGKPLTAYAMVANRHALSNPYARELVEDYAEEKGGLSIEQKIETAEILISHSFLYVNLAQIRRDYAKEVDFGSHLNRTIRYYVNNFGDDRMRVTDKSGAMRLECGNDTVAVSNEVEGVVDFILEIDRVRPVLESCTDSSVRAELGYFLDRVRYSTARSLGPSTNMYFVKNATEHSVSVRREGVFDFGLSARKTDAYPEVVSVIDDSVPEKEGVKVGDRLISVDGVDLKGASSDKIQSLLDTRDSFEIAVVVMNSDTREKSEYTLPAQYFFYVENAFRVTDDGIGYLRFAQFSDDFQDFAIGASNAIQQYNIERVILDLRGNRGGHWKNVVDAVDLFLPSGVIIAKTKGRTPSSNAEYVSSRTDLFGGIRMVVMIDHNTSAGAEVLAQALRQYKNACLIGRQSAGYGYISTLFELKDDTILKLTTSYLYSSDGRYITDNPIKPDIPVDRPERRTSDEGSYMTVALGVARADAPWSCSPGSM